ncbi:DUF5655 domain-containing protein [Nitrososphaera viennensis]|uniref:DUF5655 domain-containing protein n=2 Tax=Nitrososphaera viennensis TaxID=1034015 RepID=A0A060HN58_9ARCH|nr:hypothetical protein [Nitrososphaera viennensis]AIC16610.1 hypothetical protein NVIE_023510 [Nitrososphaera viennensis EN76]UVS68537.1 hypothetical protein NWT39_11570 [Nitrososphaera viennensis]
MKDNNFGFLPSSSSSSGGRPFEAHLAGLQEPAKSIMADLRKFALSLGPSMIEEARPHRVVYAKTLTFRTFLDVEPAIDHLVIEIRAGGRQTPPARIIVKTQEDAERAKKAIAEAYEKIR